MISLRTNNNIYKLVCIHTPMDKTAIITKATVKQDKQVTNDYAYTYLYRQNKANKIKKITKGKYTTKTDPYIIATNLFTPSYLSFWSASYFKGYTEQIVNTLQIATTIKKKQIFFENYTFEFTKLSKKAFFGFEKIYYGNDFIFIATDEKLLIDAILYPKKMGNFDEIEKICINSTIKKDLVIEYLKKINNKSLNKKIGFLLEKYKKIDISKEIMFKDTNTILLSKFQEGKHINSKWRIKHDY